MLEPVIEPGREAQSFAGSNRLGYVHTESTPIDTQSHIHEPAVEAWDPPRRQAIGTVAHEPRLARVREDDDVEPFQPEEPRPATPFLAVGPVVLGWVVTPIELHVAAVLGLEGNHAIARRHARLRERRIGERVVAGAGAERMARHRVGAAEGEAPLQRQRVAAYPSAADQPDVHATRWTDAGVVPDVEEHPVEAVRRRVGNGIPDRRGDARMRHDVAAAGILECRPYQPPRRGFFGVVARVQHGAGSDRREMAFVDRGVGSPDLGVPEHGPRILIGDARLPFVAQLEREGDLLLRLRERARRPSLIEEVVAIVAAKQKRAPPDLGVVQAPIFDRRYHVECADAEAEGPYVTRPQLAAEHVAEIAALVREIAGRPEDAQRVHAHPEVLLQLPVEQRAEPDGQPLDAVERAARGDRERGARVRIAPRYVRAGIEEPAPQVRRVHELVAFMAQAIEQGLAVLPNLATDARLGGVIHRPADDDDVARHLGARVEEQIAVDHDERALHAARDEHRAAADGHIAAPFVAARQPRAADEPRGSRRVVETDDFLGHDPRQRACFERRARAVGVNDDRRVLKGHQGEQKRDHRSAFSGGSIPRRRIRRYRFARSVCSLRAASATLPRDADSAFAINSRSYWSSVSVSAMSRHTLSPPLSVEGRGAVPSDGSTRATSAAVMGSAVARIAIRSTMLASSRTFPGQE